MKINITEITNFENVVYIATSSNTIFTIDLNTIWKEKSFIDGKLHLILIFSLHK